MTVDTNDALATARPVLTEDMIEAACRAAAETIIPNADPDFQIPNGHGGTWSIWQSCRLMIEPALKAALDRAAAPQSEEARHDD